MVPYNWTSGGATSDQLPWRKQLQTKLNQSVSGETDMSSRVKMCFSGTNNISGLGFCQTCVWIDPSAVSEDLTGNVITPVWWLEVFN